MSQRINATPVRSQAPVSQENMMPPGFAAGTGPLKPLAASSMGAPASTGPQVRSLKLNEASVKSSKSKLVELMVNTPSARRKLGNVCVNTPGTNGSLKSTGSGLGGFKKPLTPAPHHRKDEAFVKPLNFAKPASTEDQGAVQLASMKAVPSLPTLFEAEMEHCDPPTWQELREDWDPMTAHLHHLDDLSSMRFSSDDSEVEDADSQKENIEIVDRRRPLQVSFGKPSLTAANSYRRQAKKASSNFNRLLTLDEICDLA